MPNTAVRNKVELNGNARPSISDTLPQPTAPIIIYRRISAFACHKGGWRVMNNRRNVDCVEMGGLMEGTGERTPAIVEADSKPTIRELRSKWICTRGNMTAVADGQTPRLSAVVMKAG